jgi:hypothetical protein
MRVPVGSFCFLARSMQKRGAGMRSWLGTGCALALVCACASPRAALAQAAASTASTIPATSKASGDADKPNTKSNTAATVHKKRSSSHKSGKRKAVARGQQKIDPQRAQEIQEALIQEHYLSGEAAGTWNQASEDAMRRYQADHGWQSKTVPDARALISLGLGPNHDHLLNPESAMTTEPVTHASSLTPASHSADPGTPVNTTPPAPRAPATAAQHDGSSPQ